MTDKAARLNAMIGDNSSKPRKPKSDKVVHYKRDEPSEMTPPVSRGSAKKSRQILWSLREHGHHLHLHHKTDSCDLCRSTKGRKLTWPNLHFQTVWLPKTLDEANLSARNQPAWQVISVPTSITSLETSCSKMNSTHSLLH